MKMTITYLEMFVIVKNDVFRRRTKGERLGNNGWDGTFFFFSISRNRD